MRQVFFCFRLALAAVGTWLFWVVLTDNTGWREMTCGAGAAAISMVATILFVWKIKANFRPRAKFLQQAVYVPGHVVTDTGRLVLTVVRRIFGARPASGIMAVPFRRGANMPSSRMRRALAITYFTTTPNTLVLGISQEPELFLFHTIVPTPLPQFMERMGAEPEHER
jgi:multisubunit Na+/H+ antiporter MnhE subunit